MTKTLDKTAVDALTYSQSVAEAWRILLRIVHSYGWDHAVYGVNRLRFAGTFGEKPHGFVVTDLPEEVKSAFWDEGLYRHLSAVRWAISHTGSLSLATAAQTVHQGEASEAEQLAHQAMIDFGLTSGYVVGFNQPGNTTVAGLGLLNFGKTHEETHATWAEFGHEMESYARIFHLRMAALPLPMNPLTVRQRDVLRWVARGKTTAEIATILGLSQATIEKHLRQARENLGASNTAQALLNAQVVTGLHETTPVSNG